MQHILMIEDDTRLAQMVGEYLGQSGFGFSHAGDARSGTHRLLTDLVRLGYVRQTRGHGD